MDQKHAAVKLKFFNQKMILKDLNSVENVGFKTGLNDNLY